MTLRDDNNDMEDTSIDDLRSTAPTLNEEGQLAWTRDELSYLDKQEMKIKWGVAAFVCFSILLGFALYFGLGR
jgi:hypothetical protein